ncbi:hypothetical protein ABEKA_1093 [Acinetobacter lwoffii]|nr:hypothetical protein ABEKA_1093 [Acinetobacter lwoffii]
MLISLYFRKKLTQKYVNSLLIFIFLTSPIFKLKTQLSLFLKERVQIET